LRHLRGLAHLAQSLADVEFLHAGGPLFCLVYG
jgi:hypothetical protein